MKKNIIIYTALGIIILIAVILRFYMLGSAPKGMYSDETAIGYNAYSILKTGKDEFGKSYPVIFRSFTDFKTPVYIYLAAISVSLFGLTPFSTRFISGFLGVLTIPFLFLLVKNLTPNKAKLNGNLLGLISSLILAISPWHTFFSRSAFETNIALFFLISGPYFFYKAIGFTNAKNSQEYYLIPAAFLFAICITSYHAQRVIVPLIGLLLFLRHRSVLLSKPFRPSLIASVVVGSIVMIPTLYAASTDGFWMRAGLNIFSSTSSGFVESGSPLLNTIINNKLFLSSREFISLYTTYFSPRSIFAIGDSDVRSNIPGLSVFFVWQLPFFAYGLYTFVKEKSLGELRFITLVLLLVSPLAAATVRDPFSTIRSLPMVIPLTILVGLGMLQTYKYLSSTFKNRRTIVNYMSLITIVGLVTLSIARLWSSMIITNEHYRAHEWNYGVEEAVSVLDKLDHNMPVIMDNARVEHYTALLFFKAHDPVTYQEENKEVNLDEYYEDMERVKEKKIGNIVTRPIDWERDLLVEQYLVGDSLAISDNQIERHSLELIQDILYPNDKIAFRIVRVPSK